MNRAPVAPPAGRLAPGAHPPWCARDHRCNLGEHRADPISLRAPGGVVVLTRVLAATGTQHVEIRTRISLADGEPAARTHLARILGHLEVFLRRATHPRPATPPGPGTYPGRGDARAGVR